MSLVFMEKNDMKEKTFYTLLQKDNVVIAAKKEGFQFKKRGILLYIYQKQNGFCYVIDPWTGVAIYGEFFDIEDIDFFLTDDKIDLLKERRKTEKYKVHRKMFAKYKKTEILKENINK